MLTWHPRAYFDPNQPRDRRGRWSDTGKGTALKRLSEQELHTRWARFDRELTPYIGKPYAPEAQKLIEQQKDVTKEMHRRRLGHGRHVRRSLGDPRDVVIIGSGPAGLSAAIYGATEGLDTLLVDASPEPGGQAGLSSRIENVIGFPAGTTGEQFAQASLSQAQRAGAETAFGVRVIRLRYDASTGLKKLEMSDGSVLTARSVVIAGGVQFRQIRFPGSDSEDVVYGDVKRMRERARGRGAVIIGGANSAGQAAVDLLDKGENVTVVVRDGPIRREMSDYLATQLENHPRATLLTGETEKLELDENGRLKMVVLKDGRKLEAGVLGLFIGSVPQAGWADVERDERGYITTGDGNRDQLETSVPGVFAAGDVRSGSIRRVITAAADGAVAISMSHKHLTAEDFRRQLEDVEEDDEANRWLEWVYEFDRERQFYDEAEVEFFDPAQPRDRRGRWTDTGLGSALTRPYLTEPPGASWIEYGQFKGRRDQLPVGVTDALRQLRDEPMELPAWEMDAGAGMEPEGIYKVAGGTLMRRAGVPVFVESGVGERDEYLEKFEAAMDNVPAHLRERLRLFSLFAWPNPSDAFYARQAGMEEGSVSAEASAGQGHMMIWDVDRNDVREESVWHEFGHLVVDDDDVPEERERMDSDDYDGGIVNGPSHVRSWIDAAHADLEYHAKIVYELEGVEAPDWYNPEFFILDYEGTTPITLGSRGSTPYGNSDLREDWAEAVRLLLWNRKYGSFTTMRDGREVNYDDLFPSRAPLLEEALAPPPEQATLFTDEAEIEFFDPRQPRDRIGRWTLGLTPFRPEDDPTGFFESEKFKRFERQLGKAAARHGVTIDRQERAQGFWLGEQEPTLAVEAHDGPEGVAALAEEVRDAWDQDGVLHFADDPDGGDIRFTLTGVRGDAASALTEVGIDGATIHEGTVVVYGDESLAEKVARLRDALGAVVEMSAGRLGFAERPAVA